MEKWFCHLWIVIKGESAYNEAHTQECDPAWRVVVMTRDLNVPHHTHPYCQILPETHIVFFVILMFYASSVFAATYKVLELRFM